MLTIDFNRNLKTFHSSMECSRSFVHMVVHMDVHMAVHMFLKTIKGDRFPVKLRYPLKHSCSQHSKDK